MRKPLTRANECKIEKDEFYGIRVTSMTQRSRDEQQNLAVELNEKSPVVLNDDLQGALFPMLLRVGRKYFVGTDKF